MRRPRSIASRKSIWRTSEEAFPSGELPWNVLGRDIGKDAPPAALAADGGEANRLKIRPKIAVEKTFHEDLILNRGALRHNLCGWA